MTDSNKDRAREFREAYERWPAGKGFAASETARADAAEAALRAANERLIDIGCVLFNYPTIPEGYRSNIQWRNVRAELEEERNRELQAELRDTEANNNANVKEAESRIEALQDRVRVLEEALHQIEPLTVGRIGSPTAAQSLTRIGSIIDALSLEPQAKQDKP